MTARPASGGFTLLEVLVAITVMGILASLLAGGLRFGTRVWQGGEERLETLASIQSAHGLMRRELSQALPLEAGGGESMLFEGDPGYVRFAGPAPSRSVAGGLYEVVFGLSYNDVGRQLVIAWRRLATATADMGLGVGDAGFSAFAQGESTQVVLLDGVADLRIAYFGATEDGEEPQWTDNWIGQNSLPALVRVMVSFPEGDRRQWPQLVVAPMVDMPLTQ